MENGDIIEAKHIISNAGVVNTNRDLLSQQGSISSKLADRLDTVKQTKSYVCLHLGLNRSAKDLGIKNTNLWIYPDYDHDKSVENYINDQNADFPVLYVSFPSAKDEVWDQDHPNSATMEAITLGRWSWYKKWEDHEWKKRGDDYENKDK